MQGIRAFPMNPPIILGASSSRDFFMRGMTLWSDLSITGPLRPLFHSDSFLLHSFRFLAEK